MEGAITAISRTIGTITTSLQQIENEGAKAGGLSGSIADSVQRLSGELNRLESVLKEHMSGHVGVLSESLVGRGGFWKGIWLVVGVQATGWICYEIYRTRKDKGKKFL